MGNGQGKHLDNNRKKSQKSPRPSPEPKKEPTPPTPKENKDITKTLESAAETVPLPDAPKRGSSPKEISPRKGSAQNDEAKSPRNPAVAAISAEKIVDRRGSKTSTNSSASGEKPAQLERRMSKRVSSSNLITEKERVTVKFEKQVSYGGSSKKEEVILTAAHKGFSINYIMLTLLTEKRPDLQGLYDMIGKQSWLEEGRLFTKFLIEIVLNLHNLEDIDRRCQEFGKKHVDWRQLGFKPDFWVTVADAMTTECLYLDEGVHPPAEVIDAWGSLITLMFSSMRDGYYERLRKERRASKRMNRHPSIGNSRTSVDSEETNHQNQEENTEILDTLQKFQTKAEGPHMNGKSTAVIISDFFK